ncbi:MAG TPA: hypothetical protein VE999_01895 [Gemmataceae bacterium]|nr:hypothetical protein [Gemmataceae bacterium]
MRITLRFPFIIMAIVCVLLFIVGPIAIGVTVLLLAPPEIGIPVALGAVAFSAFLAWAMSSSYHWIEVQDDVIRGRKLLTRRIVERRLDDIVRILPLHSKLMGDLENAVLDILLKTSNRGYALQFRDGLKIGLVRGDMAGLNDFLLVLHDRLGERWESLTV